MRLLACLVLLPIAACSTKHPAPKQEAVAPAQPSKDPSSDPWQVADGPALGSAEPVPKWASDPPAVLRAKILGVNAHVDVLKSVATFAEYRDVLAVVEKTPGVVAAEPFIFAELYIASAERAPIGVAVKGVDPSRVGRVLAVGTHMVAGSIDSLAKGEPAPIVLGDDLARKLDVKIGDEVTVSPPKDPPSSAKPKVFRVSALFHMDFDEYDERLALTSLSALQAMLGRGDQVMGIEMTVKDLDHSDDIASTIEKALGGPPYQAMDWYELNKNLFTALYGQRRP
ncbi:MAG TPA: ABC transporter permease [Kofleriaceae bacterium]